MKKTQDAMLKGSSPTRAGSMVVLAWFTLLAHPCSSEALSVLSPPDPTYTTLHQAAEACDVQAGTTALAAWPSELRVAAINRCDREGYTPLAYAARRGCLSLVKVLIEADALIDAGRETPPGWTPLLHAAAQGHAEVASYLLAHGADANSKARAGQTPLTEAILASVFQFGPVGDRNGTIQVLLNHGADVNVPGRFGWTPLIAAVLRGNTDLVRLLVDYGANIRAEDDRGETAWDYARERSEWEIVDLLAPTQQGTRRSPRSSP